MAFPSSSGTVKGNLSGAWDMARDIAGHIKMRAVNLRSASVAGAITSDTMLVYIANLAEWRTSLIAISQLPGMVAYARAQINDPNVDIAAEFNAMIAGLDGVVSWVVTNFPKDGSGFLLAKTFNADNSGRTVDRTFSAAQTAGLRTVLDTLIAAIN
jgi:hypothetical protein